MGLIAPLAALLGFEIEGLAARARATAIIYGIIAVFLVIGVTFLLLAGYLALAEQFGGIIASLILGGGFVLLALAVYLGALIGRGRQKREVAERRRSNETSAFVTTAAITALPMLLRAPLLLKLGLPAAAIAVYAIMRDQSNED